jgi:hypothetical protein
LKDEPNVFDQGYRFGDILNHCKILKSIKRSIFLVELQFFFDITKKKLDKKHFSFSEY